MDWSCLRGSLNVFANVLKSMRVVNDSRGLGWFGDPQSCSGNDTWLVGSGVSMDSGCAEDPPKHLGNALQSTGADAFMNLGWLLDPKRWSENVLGSAEADALTVHVLAERPKF